MKRKMSYDVALSHFNSVLNRLSHGATPVYEVRSFAINTFQGLRHGIESVPAGAAIWQHTDRWHTAAIYIKQGHGRQFNRNLLDLIAAGVDSAEKFKQLWFSQNNYEYYGFFPKLSVSSTSGSRSKQASYIVADLSKGAADTSLIRGHLTPDTPHRTHLISAQTTGIEQHKGLLIDFDGWLNVKPLNDFETAMLNHSAIADMIWCANIWITGVGLHYRYSIFNPDWSLFQQKEWVDDRWSYIWYFDDGQNLLSS